MAESSLSISKIELDAAVGDIAGFGRGPNFGGHAWDDRQQRQIDNAVKIGQRWVYFCHELIGVDGKQVIPGGYEHSFLKPVAQVTLLQNTNTVEMADDFSGIVGQVIPAQQSGIGPQFPIRVIGEGQMYAQESIFPSRTGRPFWCIVEQPKGTTPTEGTRARLRFYPTADADYTLKLWYDVIPEAVTDARPFPYGGAQHGETFRTAVRAAYDLEYNDQRANAWAIFIERLKASIAMDRRMKPVELGLNLDRSDSIGSLNGPWGKHIGPFGLDINGTDVLVWSAY